MVEEMRKRVEANDPVSICLLANSYLLSSRKWRFATGYRAKTMELYAKAAELGDSDAHCKLGKMYDEGGDLKKAVFHNEAAAMAGH
jgi:TPR repeat protein